MCVCSCCSLGLNKLAAIERWPDYTGLLWDPTSRLVRSVMAVLDRCHCLQGGVTSVIPPVTD